MYTIVFVYTRVTTLCIIENHSGLCRFRLEGLIAHTALFPSSEADLTRRQTMLGCVAE